MPAKPAKDGDTAKATGRARSASTPAAEAAAGAPSGRGLKLHHLRPGARGAYREDPGRPG